MKIVLRTGTHEYGLMRPHEVRESDRVHPLANEFSARVFLSSIAEIATSLQSMRLALFESHDTIDVFAMSEHDVLNVYAALIAGGMLRITVNEIEPVHLDLGEGTATGASAPGQEAPQEIKPPPIVPQEYPILARVESDEVMSSTRKLVQALQDLKFLGFSHLKTPSQIAHEYMATAKSTAESTRAEIDDLSIDVESELYRKSDMRRPPSEVGDEMIASAKSTSKQAGFVVERMSRDLSQALFEKRNLESPPSTLATAFLDAASSTSAGIKGAVTNMRFDLERLGAKAEERTLPSPELSLECKQLGVTQAKQISATLNHLAADLGSMLFNKNELNNIRTETPGEGSDASQ